MSASLTTRTTLCPSPSRAQTGKLTPFRVQYIPIVRRRIFEFARIDEDADKTRPAHEWRQMAVIWTTEGSDTFTLQYYPYKETPQIVTELPLSALGQAAADLVAAGF